MQNKYQHTRCDQHDGKYAGHIEVTFTGDRQIGVHRQKRRPSPQDCGVAELGDGHHKDQQGGF